MPLPPDNLPGTRILPVTDAREGHGMLEAGSVDAYAGDRIKLVGLAVQNAMPASSSC